MVTLESTGNGGKPVMTIDLASEYCRQPPFVKLTLNVPVLFSFIDLPITEGIIFAQLLSACNCCHSYVAPASTFVTVMLSELIAITGFADTDAVTMLPATPEVLTQAALLVMSTVTWSLSFKVFVVNVLIFVPTFAPFNIHW